MLGFLLLASASAAAPVNDRLAEAHHAIEAGRIDQARAMIAGEMAKGAKGAPVDQLLGDLAFAAGNHTEAAARYELLLNAGRTDARLLERAAISSAKSGWMARAAVLAERAVAAPGASWRAWNVRGVIADLRNEFALADDSYTRAKALAPGNGDVLNNLGWSYLLRGEWEKAMATLEQAAAANPKSERTANNLELARAALAHDLPRRRPREPDTAYAARLNDAGVAAQARGERKRAIAAFAQAIQARGRWYRRAAQNLERAEVAQ